jgi:hypothetical protein
MKNISFLKTIPDDIFRHFVLVYRVNNEYLDTARTAFFEELKERVKHPSIIDFNDNFPLTLYVSRNGGVLYSAAGYRIGAGQDTLKIIRQE